MRAKMRDIRCLSVHPTHGIQCLAYVDEKGEISRGEPHIRHAATRRVRGVIKNEFWTDEDVALHEQQLAYRLDSVANEARRAKLRQELSEEAPTDPCVLIYEYKPEALIVEADEVTMAMVRQYMRVYPGGLSDQKMASLDPLRAIEDADGAVNNVATPSKIAAKRLRLEKRGVVHCIGFTRLRNSKSDTRVWGLTPAYAALLDAAVGKDPNATDTRERWDFFGPVEATQHVGPSPTGSDANREGMREYSN